jgi:Ricin-type beta-trefoil lectin domain-like
MRLGKEGVRLVARAFAGRRLVVALVTAGLALSLTSAVMASPASAAPFHWSYQNASHSTCLSSGGVHNGTVKAVTCAGSNVVWHYGAAHGAYAQLINNDGQCLSVAGGSASAGAHAVMANCSGNDAMFWVPENNFPGFVVDILNQHSQMVLQIACNCGTSGATVIQSPYNNSGPPNQLWYPQAEG